MSLYQTEQRQAKTTRILVYPNITFAKDLEKDSYIQVIKKQITLLISMINLNYSILILFMKIFLILSITNQKK